MPIAPTKFDSADSGAASTGARSAGDAYRWTMLTKACPGLEPAALTRPFGELGIDSFGLLALRADLEKHLGRSIADDEWLELRTPRDMLNLAPAEPVADANRDVADDLTTTRRYRINMPQMALGGLSESWLFKELGDLHWSLVCEALEERSDRLVDAAGNRLYATFTRVRIENSAALRKFGENSPLALQSRLMRFGAGMFFSRVEGAGSAGALAATLMTTFAARGAGNSVLLKGEPRIPPGCRAREERTFPEFGEHYRELRRGSESTVELSGQRLSIKSGTLHEEPYQLDPYRDVNGVLLLYFAAYPVINDICERRALLALPDLRPCEGDWAVAASTVARDVFYFGNCDLHDGISYRLHAIESAPSGLCKLVSSLHRKSDDARIASIFTIKQLDE